ncbi:hypothetical protein BLNAU_19345 [Blattamonas nauphoetae]|uniref:Protein kinase domain-containing protein n=1 Tax=Blattamonas nauphoetae TaxID=2049346 RepID=A0ABQ9X466_9EUKA|nr:hypothetical protein BLNAU_19345 [Blattamonas nauphoetae]
MNSFLVILALLLSTKSHLPNAPNSFRSLLSTLNSKGNEDGHPKSKILRLNKDVVISSAIPIRSEDVSLIGNRTTFLFQEHDWPNSEHPVSSPNQQSTSRTSPRSPQSSDHQTTATMFMFDVRNSTFCVEGVHALVNSDSKSICSLAGSFVQFSCSSITCSSDICPFVIIPSENGERSLGSTVMLCCVRHDSGWDWIVPFVGVGDGHTPLVSSASADLSDLVRAEMEGISVIGTSLCLESIQLIFGTGALFSFGVSEQGCSLGASGCGLQVDTRLLSSTLVNVSSSSPISPGQPLFGNEVSQGVVGSSVSHSTNHDSGTGMMSANLGGNVMCLNTSFSSCIRQRNDDLTFSLENRTQTHIGRLVKDYTSEATSVSLTLCTFNEMTIAAGSGLGGAAIILCQTSSSLTIRTCFFHRCTCTERNDNGGAIFFRCPSYSKQALTIFDSSFTECSTLYSSTSLNCGGSIFVDDASLTSIDRCFFERSTAENDGAMYVLSTVISISNSAFVDCAATDRAGTIYIDRVTTLSLSFVRFRGCSSENVPRAKDLYFFDKISKYITADMIQSCDSTSGAPNVFFYADNQATFTLIPQIDPTTNTTISVDVSFTENEAKVRVVTTESMKGTMNVLLDGSNVPRLVNVGFGDDTTPSNLGTAVVTSGPNGILPRADYAIRSAAVTGYRIFVGPFISEASSSLKDWNTTEIVVSGANLKDGRYSILVEKDGNEVNVTLTRSDSTTLVGTAPLHPSTAKGRLEWSTEYKVTKVMWKHLDQQTEEEVTLPDTLTFTTPDAPIRITLASCSLGGDQQESALVTLTGVKLGGGKTFSVGVRKMEGSTLIGDEIVLRGTLSGPSSSTTHAHSVAIYGNPDALLSFGTTYLITMVSVTGSVSVVDADVTFSVPSEPPRIEGVKCWLNGKRDMLIVELSGSALSSSGQTVVLSGSSGNVSSSGVIFNVTSSKCFVNFSIGSSGSSSEVVFGGRYDLLSVGSGSSSFIVKTGLFIEVPHPPRITSITTPNEVNSSSFVLSVSGSNLPSGETFTVILISGHSFTVSFRSPSTGTSTVKIGGSREIQYNTDYSIKSVMRTESGEDAEHILFPSTPFKTPLGPTLSSISCAFSSSSPNILNVSLSTERMPLEVFTLTLKSTKSPSETICLTITSSDISAGFVLVEVYKESKTLKYGTEYSIVGMTSLSVVGVVTALAFSTPSKPIRITSADCSLGGDQQKSALVTLTGVKLGGGKTFSVGVRMMGGSTLIGDEIKLSGKLSGDSSSTTHSLSVVIIGTANPLLSLGTKYVITRLEVSGSVCVVDQDVTFSVPPEPPRIVRMEKRELTKDRTKVIVLLEGRAFVSRTGKVSLTNGISNWESLLDVNIVDDTQCTAEFAVGEVETSKHLSSGETYTLKGSWTESSGFHVEDGITVVVPFPPMVTQMDFVFSNTLHTGCFVKLTGTDLIVGKSLNVTLNDSLSFIATITSETAAQSTEMLIGWPTTLQHNKQYTITSIEATDPDDGMTLFDPAVSNSTGSLPDDVVIFVDRGSTSDSTLFCGDRKRPCSWIEDGWKIVEGIGISSLSLSIVHNTTQREQARMERDHEVVISSGPSTKPELFVSASSSLLSEMEGEGMVEVVGGRLWIHQVDVVLSDSPSLIFIRIVAGHLMIETCSLTSTSSTPSNSDSSLCLWSGGAIVLEQATTTITSSTFSELSFGAINMEGGSLKIETSAFHDNNPQSSSFPSLRHNIHCSGEGQLKIGSLSGGDGKVDHPHLWLSNEDCSLSGEDVNANAPFFIPTLSSSSTSTLNKTSQVFDLTIKGTTLIPCSLFLEVFEKKKDGSEGKMVRIGLSVDSSKSFNETEIEMSLPVSWMSEFEKGLEWRGRVVFGQNETTTSVLIQKNSVDRAAQSVNENMKWWIPILVSVVCLLLLIVIVVVIFWHRRKQTKQNTGQRLTIQEMNDEEATGMELEQKMEETVCGNSVDYLIKSQQTVTPKMNQPDATATLIPIETHVLLEVLGESGEVGVVDWMKAETLFDCLHRPEKKREIEKKALSRSMTKGLIRILAEHPTSPITTRFSPHWVLVNKNVVQLRLAPIPEEPPERNQVTQNQEQQEMTILGDQNKSFFGGRLSAVKSGTVEGQRWRAPEASRSNVEKIDVESALVFSLGLVLWEVWTGEVPWKEMDEANAGRQNEGGIQPNLKLVLDTLIRELISKCLSFDPKERPSLKDVLHGLGGPESKPPEQPSRVAKVRDTLDVRS